MAQSSLKSPTDIKSDLTIFRLDVHDAVCTSKMPYGTSTATEWSNDRFQKWWQKNVAIISGSTYADAKKHTNETILDASAARKYYDKDGVLLGVNLMTLDGLGHSPDSKVQAFISNDNKLMISEIDKALVSPAASQEHLVAAIATAGEAAYQLREQQFQSIARPLYANGSAMTIASIIYEEKTHKLQCSLANIGDTMGVVVDKNFKIKAICPARQYKNLDEKRHTRLYPVPVHLIQYNQDALLPPKSDAKSIEVVPGDIILLMSDGIFQELPLQFERIDKSQNEKKGSGQEHKNDLQKKSPDDKYRLQKTTAATGYCDIRLKDGAFRDIKSLHGQVELSEYDIGTAILQHVQDQTTYNRQEVIKSQQKFEQWYHAHFKHMVSYVNELFADSELI